MLLWVFFFIPSSCLPPPFIHHQTRKRSSRPLTSSLCFLRISGDTTDTMAPSQRRRATRASSGRCSTKGSKSQRRRSAHLKSHVYYLLWRNSPLAVWYLSVSVQEANQETFSKCFLSLFLIMSFVTCFSILQTPCKHSIITANATN